MKVSREQVELNRERILQEASRLFRAKGYDDVTVAEVMHAAGLTHGGFYGYFQSKEDLIAQTLAHALAPSETDDADLASYMGGYLSAAHRDNLAGGCPVAALGAETVRQSPESRAEMTAALRRRIELFSQTAPGLTPAQRRKAAIGNWAAMVGALILARVSDDPGLSNEVLNKTRAWIRDKS